MESPISAAVAAVHRVLKKNLRMVWMSWNVKHTEMDREMEEYITRGIGFDGRIWIYTRIATSLEDCGALRHRKHSVYYTIIFSSIPVA
jgi:hypothetical protein